MLKKTGLLILAGIFAISSAGFAGTVGNPASTDSPKGPGVFSMKQHSNLAFKAGVDLEFLFDRDLHADAAFNTKLTSGEWCMARISFVILDRVEPYVKLGVAHMKAKWSEAGHEAKLDSDTGFSWGLGAKALIYEIPKPKIKLVADGYWRIANMDVSNGYVDGVKIPLDTSKSRFTIREWQLALLAATDIDITGPGKPEVMGISTLTPYAGIKYSDIGGRLRLMQTNNAYYNNPGNIDADNNFGILVGCDFVGSSSVSVNLEGRFIDETAMTTGLSVLF